MRLLQLAFLVALASGIGALLVYITGVSNFGNQNASFKFVCRLRLILWWVCDCVWECVLCFCRWATSSFQWWSGSIEIFTDSFPQVCGQFWVIVSASFISQVMKSHYILVLLFNCIICWLRNVNMNAFVILLLFIWRYVCVCVCALLSTRMLKSYETQTKFYCNIQF